MRLSNATAHKGLKHTMFTYNTLLVDFYQTGRTDDAESIRNRMTNAAAATDIPRIPCNFGRLCKNRPLNEAKSIKTFTILVDGMIRVGTTNRAWDLFNALFVEGLMPDL